MRPMTTTDRALFRVPAILALAWSPITAMAQQPLPGYSAVGSATERVLEAEAIARPDAARARTHSRELSKDTHVAGTPAQQRTRDYVVAQMKAMGLETEVRQYDVFIPHATSVAVWRVGPKPKKMAPAPPPRTGHPAPHRPRNPATHNPSGGGAHRGAR